MSNRSSRHASPESGKQARDSRKGRQAVNGLVLVLAAATFGGLLFASEDGKSTLSNHRPSTPNKVPPHEVDPINDTKYDLLHSYMQGTVKLEYATATGIRPKSSIRPSDREIVQAHISYMPGHTPRYLSVKGDPLPPKEVVIDADGNQRPGVVNWAEYPSTKDVNMQVEYGAFSCKNTVTRKYRLYLTAMDPAGFHGKPLASEAYAGTVDISGKNGSLDSVTVEHEPNIPQVRLIHPTHASDLYGVPNDNPNNG